MRKHRRGSENAPSLFPFLAVLLCTMGAIVFLLILTVAKAGETARSWIEDKVTEEEQALEDLLYVAVDERTATRESAVEELESLRQRLQHFEGSIRQLHDELEELTMREQVLETGRASSPPSEAIDDRLANLKRESERLQRELEEKSNAAKNRQPAFAILPYQGRQGTTRRPIYLECLSDRLVLQPEGIEFSLRDLAPPYHPGGPLDAVLRTIRSHYQDLDATMSSYSSPYPLILVRPSGIRTFALTRNALQGWDDQFGYELIDERMPLAFPPSAPGIRPKMESSLAAARQRQAALLASIPRSVLDPSMLDQWIQQPIGANRLSGGSSSGDRNAGPDSADRSSGLNGDWKMIKEFERGSDPQNASLAQGDPMIPSPLDSVASSATPSHTSDFMRDLQNLNHLRSDSNDWVVNHGMNPQDRSYARFRDSAAGIALQGQNDFLWTETPQPELGGQESSSQPTGDFSSANGAIPMNGNGSSRGSQSLEQGRNANEQSPATGSGMSGTATPPVASMPNDSGTMPSMTFQVDSSQADRDMKPISVSQGRDWATARAAGKQTAVLRQIEMVVLPDCWILLADTNARRAETTIRLDQPWKEITDQLSRAIRGRIDGWGIAVAGGYWKPLIQAEILTPQSPSLKALERALEGSGIQLETIPFRTNPAVQDKNGSK